MAALHLGSAYFITSYICYSRNSIALHVKFTVADVSGTTLCIIKMACCNISSLKKLKMGKALLLEACWQEGRWEKGVCIEELQSESGEEGAESIKQLN